MVGTFGITVDSFMAAGIAAQSTRVGQYDGETPLEKPLRVALER
jgi:hypothetical protein